MSLGEKNTKLENPHVLKGRGDLEKFCDFKHRQGIERNTAVCDTKMFHNYMQIGAKNNK